jgi:hypothetical protein
MANELTCTDDAEGVDADAVDRRLGMLGVVAMREMPWNERLRVRPRRRSAPSVTMLRASTPGASVSDHSAVARSAASPAASSREYAFTARARCFTVRAPRPTTSETRAPEARTRPRPGVVMMTLPCLAFERR